MTAIQAHVWEGESIFGQISQIYGSIYFGLAILGMVIRDYRLVHYGTSSREPAIDRGADRVDPPRP